MGSHSHMFTIIDVNAENSSITDLHKAAAGNDVNLVKQLLSQGARIDAKNIHNDTPLHYAARKNEDDSHYEVIQTLLKNGANVDVKNYCDQTPFHYLVLQGNSKIVKLFLDYKADLKTVDYLKRNLLQQAIYNHKNLDVLQLLIDQGLNVNLYDDAGKTALHEVAINTVGDDFISVAELLIKNGADLTLQDKALSTPFERVFHSGNAKIIRLFLKYTPNFKIKSHEAQMLFLRAVGSNKNVDAVQMMIDLGLNVHYCYNEGEPQTALHHACSVETSSIEVIKCLLKNGASMNAFNFDNSTPLAYAMYKSLLSDPSEKWQRKVQFIVEHTDLSINVSKESHIFHLYNDQPPGNYETVLAHIAKLEALNIPVHQVLLDAIDEHPFIYGIYIEFECNEELELAKSTNLGKSWVSFYNLLLDSRKSLKNYAGNKDLIEVFKKSDCEKFFPIYGASMVRNVNKAIKRRELYDQSVDLLSDCLPIFHPTHLVIRDILDRILSKKDLSKFCN